MIVTFADDEPNGLAWMLGELITANLERHPERRRLLRPGVIDLTAADADVSVRLSLGPEGVVVANRPEPDANRHLHVRTDAQTLLLLASVPLRLGYPDPLTRAGRRVLRLLARGHIRIDGLLLHPGKLSRLSRLLSVV